MKKLSTTLLTCALLAVGPTPLLAQDFDQFVDPDAVEEEQAPEAEKPEAEKPEAEKPEAEQPVAEEPEAEQPVAEEPVAEVPVAEEPVAEVPVAEEPVAEVPVAEVPVAEVPVAEQPVAEQPVAEQPVAEGTGAEELPAEGTEAESQPAEGEVQEIEATAPTSAPAEAGVESTQTRESFGAARIDVEAGPIYSRGGLFGIGLVIAPKVGGGLSQLFFNGLGATFVGELELGYTLPLPQPLGRDFQLFLSTAYAGPSGDDTVEANDARLPGDGSWSYQLTMHQLVFTLGVLYRIPVPIDWLRPYAALGGRLHRSWTLVRGDADGEAFGENLEEATDFGGYGALGADFFVGPGAILAELQVGFGPLDSYVMRDTNNGTLNLAIGYRFFL